MGCTCPRVATVTRPEGEPNEYWLEPNTGPYRNYEALAEWVSDHGGSAHVSPTSDRWQHLTETPALRLHVEVVLDGYIRLSGHQPLSEVLRKHFEVDGLTPYIEYDGVDRIGYVTLTADDYCQNFAHEVTTLQVNGREVTRSDALYLRYASQLPNVDSHADLFTLARIYQHGRYIDAEDWYNAAVGANIPDKDLYSQVVAQYPPGVKLALRPPAGELVPFWALRPAPIQRGPQM